MTGCRSTATGTPDGAPTEHPKNDLGSEIRCRDRERQAQQGPIGERNALACRLGYESDGDDVRPGPDQRGERPEQDRGRKQQREGGARARMIDGCHDAGEDGQHECGAPSCRRNDEGHRDHDGGEAEEEPAQRASARRDFADKILSQPADAQGFGEDESRNQQPDKVVTERGEQGLGRTGYQEGHRHRGGKCDEHVFERRHRP
jgi:hypothetical protein